jgi:hypothetical protein
MLFLPPEVYPDMFDSDFLGHQVIILLYSQLFDPDDLLKISSFSKPGYTLGDCRSSKGRNWMRHFAGCTSNNS